MTETIRPARQVFDETLGLGKGRGRLTGRHVVVLGAGQRRTVDAEPPIGNGRAISVLLAREGATVACLDRSLDAALATCEQIAAEGGRAKAYEVDATDAAQLEQVLDRCRGDMGAFDGLVANVGITHGLSLEQQTDRAWDDEYAANVRSNMVAGRYALREMASGGAVVLVSSIGGLRASTMNPAYESSKAAQMALARSIAAAGQARGIRCNAVLPGLIDTPMGRDEQRRRGAARGAIVPFGRQGTGWEVGYACVFLLSHEASYVNAQLLSVDGGLVSGIGMPRP